MPSTTKRGDPQLSRPFNVKTMIYMILQFFEKWGLAAGCEDCGRSTVEGLERRGWRDNRGEEVPFRDCTGKDGVEEDRVLCLFLVQSLCSSSPWQNGRNGAREEVPFRGCTGYSPVFYRNGRGHGAGSVPGAVFVVLWSEIAVGRRFNSEKVRGKKEWKRTWCWVCSWCSLCAPLGLLGLCLRGLCCL